LLIVVAAFMVITAVAVPSVVVKVADVRLRANMSSVSTALQNSRALAVRERERLTVRLAALQVQLKLDVSLVEPPSGKDAPTPLDSGLLGFTPVAGDPSFDSQGLLCTCSSSECMNTGLISYFSDYRPMGGRGWAAISISPSGQVKRWFWDGDSWTS
jgi:hypothetical protein